MEAASQSLGLSASYAHREHDKGFEDFRRDISKVWERKAADELAAAISEAEAEVRTHTRRLAELRGHHSKAMDMLADHRKQAIPEDADDDLVRLIDSSYEEMVRAAERFNSEFMDLVQAKHRLELEHCFTGHLVSQETARKFVEYYEVD